MEVSGEANYRPLIGFVGLGKMGAAMATNLIQAGHSLKVYNRTHAAAKPLEAVGATAVQSPTELADVDILFTMLNDASAFEAVVHEQGLLAAMTAAAELSRSSTATPDHRKLHISCATLPVEYAKTQEQLHAAAGVDYVAMPVIGRPDAAAAAQLHLLFAGRPEILQRIRPLLVPTLGQSIRVYGAEPHVANVMKISFNMMLACAIESMAEGAALVQRYGVEAGEFCSLLSETLFDCVAYRGYGKIIASRAFQPAGASLTGVGLKDTKLALQAGEVARVPLPFASVLRDNYLDAIANGMGDWDWSALAVVAEQHAGIGKSAAPPSSSTSHEH